MTEAHEHVHEPVEERIDERNDRTWRRRKVIPTDRNLLVACMDERVPVEEALGWNSAMHGSTATPVGRSPTT